MSESQNAGQKPKRSAETYFSQDSLGLNRWYRTSYHLSWGAFFVRAGAPLETTKYLEIYARQKETIENLLLKTQNKNEFFRSLGIVVEEARTRGQKNVFQVLWAAGSAVSMYYAVNSGNVTYIALAASAIILNAAVALGRHRYNNRDFYLADSEQGRYQNARGALDLPQIQKLSVSVGCPNGHW